MTEEKENKFCELFNTLYNVEIKPEDWEWKPNGRGAELCYLKWKTAQVLLSQHVDSFEARIITNGDKMYFSDENGAYVEIETTIQWKGHEFKRTQQLQILDNKMNQMFEPCYIEKKEKEKKDKLTQLNNDEMEILKQQIEFKKSQIPAIQVYINQFNNEIDFITKNKNDEINNVKIQIKPYQDQINQLNQEIISIDKSKQEAINNVKTQMKPYQDQINQLNKDIEIALDKIIKLITSNETIFNSKYTNYEPFTTDDILNTIQRCKVKCFAEFGLGAKAYQGKITKQHGQSTSFKPSPVVKDPNVTYPAVDIFDIEELVQQNNLQTTAQAIYNQFEKQGWKDKYNNQVTIAKLKIFVEKGFIK